MTREDSGQPGRSSVGERLPRAPGGTDLPTQRPAAGPQRRYRLVEFGPGRQSFEDFFAPHDDIALERAFDVGDGQMIELWRDGRLIKRWLGGSPPQGLQAQG